MNNLIVDLLQVLRCPQKKAFRFIMNVDSLCFALCNQVQKCVAVNYLRIQLFTWGDLLLLGPFLCPGSPWVIASFCDVLVFPF